MGPLGLQSHVLSLSCTHPQNAWLYCRVKASDDKDGRVLLLYCGSVGQH